MSSLRAEDAPLLLTVDDVARLLNIGRTQVYALVRDGELESVKIGRSRRFLPEQVDAYIRKLRRSVRGDDVETPGLPAKARATTNKKAVTSTRRRQEV
jgi:excisionase family DNA binding protein